MGDGTLKTGERLPLPKQVGLRLRPLPLPFLKVRTVVKISGVLPVLLINIT